MAPEEKIAMSHRFEVKIYYEDTDAGGVVYYGNYLRYLERARTEFLAAHGLDIAERHAAGELYVVARVEIDYRKPARLGDILHITTEVQEVRAASLRLRHLILKGDLLIAEAVVTIAHTDLSGKPRRLPPIFSTLR